jgi:pyruvate dehydrogenase E2 component (dihydrolipoamide acetyltransferase)
MIDVRMPRLSDSMEEGLIVAWLVRDGDQIKAGDELVEIETDKATMTFEADDGGLVQTVAEDGDTVPVGALIAHLLGPGEKPAAGNGTEVETVDSVPPDPAAAEGALSPSFPPPAGSPRIKASPLARRIAAGADLDLETVAGSGPGGRVVKHDVEQAISERTHSDAAPQREAPVAGGKGETERLIPTRLQQTAARRMAESKATIPHYYLSADIDMSGCVAARSNFRKAAGEGEPVPTFNDMVVKASALALRRFPKVNSSYRDEGIDIHSRVNVGVAVAAGDSLLVPVIPDTDQRGLIDISSRTRALAVKVRDGEISPPELSGGTFTVSNLGMFGVSSFDAVINPGQAAILAVGSIEDRPVVSDGTLMPGKIMSATLSCDHRIINGAEGAQFLAFVKRILEEPASLAL